MFLGYLLSLHWYIIGIFGVLVFFCIFVAAEEAFQVCMLLEEVKEIGEVGVVWRVEEGRHLHLQQS